jgi:hypothetical protein
MEKMVLMVHTAIMEQQSSRTWNGTRIVTDTAYLPFAFCAWLETHGPVSGPIEYAHSEEEAVERLIERLEALQAEQLCECDGDDPSVGYIGSVCAYCRGAAQRLPLAVPDAPVRQVA